MSSFALTAAVVLLAWAEAGNSAPGELHDGGIVRGRTDRREIALEFTAHEYAEGAPTILDALARHRAKASFFLTDDSHVRLGELLDDLSQKGYRFVRIDELLGK